MYLIWILKSTLIRSNTLVLFGLLPALTVQFWGAPRGEHLSIRVRSYHDQLHRPIRFPQHLFSVHDHGRQRSGRGPQHTFLPIRWPDCSSSRLRAEEYERPVTQSIATPEPGCPDLHSRSDAGRPLELWVCRHTREPTVLSRLSCRPPHLNVDRVHRPCLFP